MDCPHRNANLNRTVSCGLLTPLGILQLAGPHNPNHPCGRCESEWSAGPPTPDNPTPTLQGYIERAKGLTPIEPHPEPSSWLQAFLHAAQAGWNLIRSGFAFAPKSLQDSRLAQCSKCSWLTERMGLPVCSHCKCFLSLSVGSLNVGKTAHPGEHCPIGRWSAQGRGGCGGCG